MKRLTHKEARERQEAMRKYCSEGHTSREVAEKFGTSKDYAKKICRGINSEKRGDGSRNQYTDGTFDREANAIRYINERTPGFEYAGNFTGVDGSVDLKCKTCGEVITRSFITVRHGKVACNICKQKEAEKARAASERLNQTAQKRRQFESRRKKRLCHKTVQVKMSSCVLCGSLFVQMHSNMKYCSDTCRNQNKWQMKDGYRNLFPLEKVYERDNGICYLCGKPCDWHDFEEHDGVIVYGNNYPSRDHVIPKSKGGVNDWSNIRLAHRICNSLKADSPYIEKTG